MQNPVRVDQVERLIAEREGFSIRLPNVRDEPFRCQALGCKLNSSLREVNSGKMFRFAECPLQMVRAHSHPDLKNVFPCALVKLREIKDERLKLVASCLLAFELLSQRATDGINLSARLAVPE